MEKIFLGERKSLKNNPQNFSYRSSNKEVISIDSYGILEGKKIGSSQISITNKRNDDIDRQVWCVKRKLTYQNSLAQYLLPEKYKKTIEKSPGTFRQYLGQPDLARTSTGRLILVYPIGHGKGPLVLQISDNQGKSWVEKNNLPKSWKKSQETPTIYTLKMLDGTERLMLITGCPGNWGDFSTGWNTSFSFDDGNNWTEYRHWHSRLPTGEKNSCLVGMASLTQLKDSNGQDIEKWLGVYHSDTFINYKTYLTFDESGNEQWSTPVPYLSAYREKEIEYELCEVGVIRHRKQLIGFCRSQSHKYLSTFIISHDEGETWSTPEFLPGYLAGERHKPFFDPVSKKLLISFREIRYDLNQSGFIEDSKDWKAGNWLLWVGDLKELLEGKDSGYRICLGKDFSPNEKGGDTGYAGVTSFSSGELIMVSYGHWDKSFSCHWTGDVRTDLCYIKQAKFKLEEVEKDFCR